MTIASREIINTFLNARRQKRQSRGKQHGCLRAVRNGITGGKERVFSRREREREREKAESSGLCALTMGMRIFLARCRIVESTRVRTRWRYYRQGETRELGLLPRSG